MFLWMIRLSGFLAGVTLATAVMMAPEAAAQWPFGAPQTLDRIEQDVAKDHQNIAHIDADALEAMREGGKRIVLLDVRERREYDVSHIPGAVHVDPSVSKADVKALLMGADPDTEVVVYCSVGRRSSRLGSRLAGKLEGREISNLSGGIFAWHNEDRPLVDAHGATDAVHPYNDRWGELIEREDSISYRPISD